MTRHFHRKWWQYNVKGVCCKRHGRSRLSLIYGRPREIRRCMGNLASRHTFKSPSPCLAAPNKTLKHSETVNDLMIQYLARHLCQQLGRLIRPTTTTLIPGCSRMLQDVSFYWSIHLTSQQKRSQKEGKDAPEEQTNGGAGRVAAAETIDPSDYVALTLNPAESSGINEPSRVTSVPASHICPPESKHRRT